MTLSPQTRVFEHIKHGVINRERGRGERCCRGRHLRALTKPKIPPHYSVNTTLCEWCAAEARLQIQFDESPERTRGHGLENFGRVCASSGKSSSQPYWIKIYESRRNHEVTPPNPSMGSNRLIATVTSKLVHTIIPKCVDESQLKLKKVSFAMRMGLG